ncbi:hypothetical protein OVS_00480 [Mycoplasma ovis str. Michigan]|uniref:Uncharacterized protein n=2 Tax=Mycoplasma ovis TaxID=171632 RepID=A0ABM5P1D4_9MOLU|nr:hypothetical protein OVS_00480 [Mycoplasma ovis str. Michigan]
MKLDETAKSLGPELISDHKYSERKTIVKGECEVVFTVSDLDEFLKKQKEDKNDYVATSCKITNVKNEYISLPERWNVLFPKSVLDSNYSFKLGEKFDFYSETVPRNDLNNGGGINTFFKGTVFKNEIQGEWIYKGTIKLLSTVTTVEIKGWGLFGKRIYIYFPYERGK